MVDENATVEIQETDLENVGIGEDKPQIEAKRVLVEDYKIEPVKFGNEESKKLILQVRHPDIADRQIEISGAKYELGDKIKVSGLWFKLDNDDKLPYNGAIANLLRYLNKSKVSELKGEQLDTVTDEKGYLVVKAY